MENHEQKTKKTGRIGKIILGIVFLVVAIAGAFFAFRVVKGLVASWEINRPARCRHQTRRTNTSTRRWGGV